MNASNFANEFRKRRDDDFSTSTASVSRARTKVPSVVSTSAVYSAVSSMHIGGGFSKVVVRSAEPSAGGHGVSPVIVAPGGGTVMATLGAFLTIIAIAMPFLQTDNYGSRLKHLAKRREESAFGWQLRAGTPGGRDWTKLDPRIGRRLGG